MFSHWTLMGGDLREHVLTNIMSSFCGKKTTCTLILLCLHQKKNVLNITRSKLNGLQTMFEVLTILNWMILKVSKCLVTGLWSPITMIFLYIFAVTTQYWEFKRQHHCFDYCKLTVCESVCAVSIVWVAKPPSDPYSYGNVPFLLVFGIGIGIS